MRHAGAIAALVAAVAASSNFADAAPVVHRTQVGGAERGRGQRGTHDRRTTHHVGEQRELKTTICSKPGDPQV